MYHRDLKPIIADKCFRHKAILLLGARQVGKTTLLKEFIKEQPNDVLYLNCDDLIVVSNLTNRNIQQLKLLIGEAKLVVIDEAQKVDNIGLTIKIIVDNFPDVQIIATGSSAFELRNRLNEPLTGRKYEYQLFPISTNEIYKSNGFIEVERLLESRLIYGSYPDILTQSQEMHELLNALTDSYLYKDVLAMGELRKPELLSKLLQAIAFQVGSEVSYSELATTIGSDAKTVERYIELLEKCFIIFRLNGLSRNLRNELKKAKKIYFYDNGVRNAVIQQFAPLNMRNDIGQMQADVEKSQQEIDYIEERDGKFSIFEMKWNPKKSDVKFPSSFINAYPIAESAIITPENYLTFLI